MLCCLLITSSIEASQNAEQLVGQLGNPNFQIRASAEKQLLNLGYGSYEAITSGAASDDPEVRYRAQRLLKILQKAAFADQHFQLRKNPWLVPDELAPGWMAFHQLLGDGPDSRELYLQVLNSETDLMLSLTHPRWQVQFEKRCADLNTFAHQRRQLDLQPGSIAALLFLACHPDNRPSTSASAVIYMLLDDPKFRDAVLRSRSQDVLRALVSLWIRKSDNTSPMQRIGDAASFELDAAVGVAREVIADRYRPNTSATYLENAIFYLAKYGGPDVIEELEDLLDEKFKLRESPRPNEMDVQIRDVALVALLHITEQDPVAYGFHELRPKRGYLYIGSSAKFDSTESRNEALNRWQSWRADHLRDRGPDDLDASFGESL